MIVEIDKNSGFCYGVTRAIGGIEKILTEHDKIYCLGNIVHNNIEQERLKELGLQTIGYSDIDNIKSEHVIIRAHGEAPIIYERLKKNNINIIDKTCPVVLKLQEKIKKKYLENPDSQIFIFGKKQHPEVNGLLGQTDNTAIIISSFEEISEVEKKDKMFLFSQTTANYDEYKKIHSYLTSYAKDNNKELEFFDTICPSVTKRIPELIKFCKNYELIIFVSDNESSNGKMLYEICKSVNENSFFINSEKDIKKEWLNNIHRIGISGATSTPIWLMNNIKNYLLNL